MGRKRMSDSVFLENNKLFLAYLFAFLAVLSWATAPLLFKIGIKSLSFDLAVFWFLLFGGVVLTAINLRRIIDINRKFLFFALVVGVATSVHYLGYLNGIMSQQVSLSIAIAKTSPIFQAIFAGLLLGAGIKKRTALSMITCFVGVIFVTTNLQFQAFKFTSAIISTLAAAIAWGFLLIVMIKSEQDEILLTGVSLTFAAIFTLIFSILQGKNIALPAENSEWFWLFYLGVAPTAVGVALWAKALKMADKMVHSIIILDYLTPVIGVAACIIFLKEKISFWFIMGFALVVIGNLLRDKK